MADQPKRNFLGGLKNIGLRALDKVVLGDNYDGQTWSATPGQYIGGIGSTLAGLAIPGAGIIAR